MKHQTIHSKYHKLDGLHMRVDIGGQALDQCRYIDEAQARDMIRVLEVVPHYVIYEDLVLMLDDPNGAMQKSLDVMIDHGLVRMPFQSVVVEYDEMGMLTDEGIGMRRARIRHFIWLTEDKEADAMERFTAVTWSMLPDVYGRDTVVMSPIAAVCGMVTMHQANLLREQDPTFEVDGHGCGAMFRARLAPYMRQELVSEKESQRIISTSLKQCMGPAVRALSSLMVLLHTKGVVQDRVEINPRFNKSRVQSGKRAVQDHTVVRVGHVYGRKGEEIKTPSGRPYHGQLYWVPGHVRGVRYGPKRSRIYDLFIEPYLVNYKEGDEVPVPKTKEVSL